MAKKTKPVDEEVEEVEAEETEEATSEFGVRDLIALIKERTGKDYKPREVRNLLRKLARDGAIDREIIPGNKTKYAWDGPSDPEVRAVLKAVKGGAIETAKTEQLNKLKADKAAKKAAEAEADVEDDEDEAPKPKKSKKAAEAAPTKKAKKAPAPPVDDDDDDLEELEDDDD